MSKASGRRPFRGLTAEQRQSQRRAQLLDAGLEVFGTQGYHGVRVRDVCVKARLTERYFYESFANLEALFLAVYDRAVERIRQAIQTAIEVAPASMIGMARPALGAFLESLRDEPRLARILLIDVLTVGTDVSNRSRLATQSFADLVKSLLMELYPDLRERNVDPRLVADGLVGATVYLVMQWALDGFQEPLERILEHCALFYDALALRLPDYRLESATARHTA